MQSMKAGLIKLPQGCLVVRRKENWEGRAIKEKGKATEKREKMQVVRVREKEVKRQVRRAKQVFRILGICQ